MSTVPKADTPPPANNANTTLVSDPWSGNYGRPTAGGAATGDNQGNAGPGVTPGMGAYTPPGPASVGAANTQAGPDMGHGATIMVPSSGDRPSGGKQDATGGGTVGDSGNQGNAPSGGGS
jgi:hypothetical protein